MARDLFSPTFRYSGIGNPNITAGANLIMQGLQAPGKLAAQMSAEDRLAAQDAFAKEKWNAQMGRQATLDAQNKQLFDLGIAEANRQEQERLGKEKLASELMKLPTQKSTTQVVSPAVTAQDVESARQRLLDEKYGQAGNVYADEFAKLSAETITKPIPGQFEEVSNYEVVNVPGTSNQKYIYKETGDSLMFDPKSPIGKALYGDKYFKKDVPTAEVVNRPLRTPQEAHIEALKRAGLSEDMTGKEFTVDASKLPKESKEVTKEVMKKLSDDELKQGKLDLVRELAQSGAIPSTLALETANKINAPKTQKEKMDELKYLLDLRKENRKDQELQAKIKSGYFGKSSSGKGFSFGEKLYTLAGPDGLDAAKNYLKNNRPQLENMSTGDKKELLAYLTAKYGHEDDWFNWTGWDDLK